MPLECQSPVLPLLGYLPLLPMRASAWVGEVIVGRDYQV